MIPTSLLTTLLLSVVVAANPIVVHKSLVTLPIYKRVNITNAQDLVRHDQIRARALRGKSDAEVFDTVFDRDVGINSPLNNRALSYVASVGVGNPATFYDLMVDGGSANTWIGAGKAYVQTSTSRKTDSSVGFTYGTGYFNGTEFIDQVTLGAGLVIPKQSIGVASTSTGFNNVDGVIGIGPVGMTARSLTPDTGLIPTITDNLFSEGTITANEIGISFEPITTASGTQMNGEVTWGGTDSSKFTGEITFTSITDSSPANRYWGIDQSIKYGTTTILSTTAGIVDTGTTLILLAPNAFNAYQSATGSVLDNTGLLSITSAQFANLQNLSFIIGGRSFDLTPNAQIWPRNLNTVLGGTTGNIYLVISSIGTLSESGLDFINGLAFLERFYSVFDTANKRVGFATTPFTSATTN